MEPFSKELKIVLLYSIKTVVSHLNALNCAYAKGLLAVTQRRGIITLLAKKNKPANFLKNWRPITLLNCDYKIATKSIASRLRKVILNNYSTIFTEPEGNNCFSKISELNNRE